MLLRGRVFRETGTLGAAASWWRPWRRPELRVTTLGPLKVEWSRGEITDIGDRVL